MGLKQNPKTEKKSFVSEKYKFKRLRGGGGTKKKTQKVPILPLKLPIISNLIRKKGKIFQPYFFYFWPNGEIKPRGLLILVFFNRKKIGKRNLKTSFWGTRIVTVQ